MVLNSLSTSIDGHCTCWGNKLDRRRIHYTCMRACKMRPQSNVFAENAFQCQACCMCKLAQRLARISQLVWVLYLCLILNQLPMRSCLVSDPCQSSLQLICVTWNHGPGSRNRRTVRNHMSAIGLVSLPACYCSKMSEVLVELPSFASCCFHFLILPCLFTEGVRSRLRSSLACVVHISPPCSSTAGSFLSPACFLFRHWIRWTTCLQAFLQDYILATCEVCAQILQRHAPSLNWSAATHSSNRGMAHLNAHDVKGHELSGGVKTGLCYLPKKFFTLSQLLDFPNMTTCWLLAGNKEQKTLQKLCQITPAPHITSPSLTNNDTANGLLVTSC